MGMILFSILGVIASVQAQVNPQKLVDLTHPFDSTTLGYPGLRDFELNVTHYGTTEEGYWLQIEEYGGSIHVGTHMDAPCHIKRGQWCLDQIPVDRFFAPAAVVDITQRSNSNPDANLEILDLVQWEINNRRRLDGTVILVNSGWGRKWGDKKAFLGTAGNDVSKVHFPGVSPEAARWLRDNRSIKGLGIDTTSLDSGQAKKRMAHEALFEANIFGLENVANIDQLPPYGAQLMIFPMKITNASGAPVRIFAVIA